MKTLAELIASKKFEPDKRNTHEFQAFGNKLSEELGDTKHRALYIKLAKEIPRGILENVRDHVLNSPKAVTRGKLFMWKLKQILDEKVKSQNTETVEDKRKMA